jgi:uncharacterized membrane protein (DUF4010 family)
MGLNHIEALERLGVALALGLLIGLERGWSRREQPEGSRIAGLRTFAIISLLGAVTTLLSPQSLIPFAAAIAVVGLLMALGYWLESARQQDISLTTNIAALLVLGLGALAGKGDFISATSTAVVVALLLGFKPELHELLRRIEREELLATLRLLLISVVLLPILPDKGFGPWQAINPYRLWWLVVLVAAVSYVGYFGIKLFGHKRGVAVGGLLGGLASSTAVAVNFSHLGRGHPQNHKLLAAGVVIASAMMFPRMLVVVAVVDLHLALSLTRPLLCASLVAFAFAGCYVWQTGGQAFDAGQLEPRNPLSLRFALEFGILLAVIMLAARGVEVWIGNRGLYAIGAVSGLADVDAISLSLASMSNAGTTPAATAALAILAAAAVNTAVKAGLAWVICGLRMGLYVTIPLLAALAAGGIAMWIW